MGETAQDYRYDAAYRESVALSDGQRVSLRLIRPSDRDTLRAALARLSPESRYTRFMAPKAAIPPISNGKAPGTGIGSTSVKRIFAPKYVVVPLTCVVGKPKLLAFENRPPR